MANKAKKNVSYRLIAALLAVACVAFVFLPLKVLGGVAGYFAHTEMALYEVATDIFDSGIKLWGFLPSFCEESWLGIAATLSLYAFALTLVVGFICSFIAIFTKKAPGLVRFSTFILTWGAAIYAATLFAVSAFTSSATKFLDKATFDWYTIGLTIAGLVLYFFLQIAHTGKAAWFNAVHFLCSVLYAGLLALAFTYEGAKVRSGLASKDLWRYLALAILAFAFLNVFIASCRANSKKGLSADPIRYILQVVVSLGAVYLHYAANIDSKFYLNFAIAAGAISLVQIVIVLCQLAARRSRSVKAAKKEVLADFTVEETVVAYPYEGGPVAGVEVAELLEEEAVQEAEGETYTGQFDAFIGTLSKAEREEFIDLYILRANGSMPEIPSYSIGGENKVFFNKVFIYLGQYRDKISNALLNKIYEYSQKI